MTRLTIAILIACFAHSVSALQVPRIDEEDLVPEPFESEPSTGLQAVDSGLDEESLLALFAEAESVFQSADQPASLTLFGQIVEVLEVRLGNGQLSEESRELLLASLSYRAQAYFNFGENELVESSLARMLEIEPGADLARDLVSPKLVQQFDRLRKRTVGELILTVDPVDAIVTVDGRVVDPLSSSIYAPAGSRHLELRRAGYLPQLQVLDLAAGSSKSVEVQLERTSPVLRLASRPTDCEVLIDNVVVGSTIARSQDPDDLAQATPLLSYQQEGFSEELVLDGIELGLHVLEVRKPGYRSYRVELILDELIDYPMPPIILEEQRGILVLKDVPPDADLSINKELIAADAGNGRTRRLSLPPGDYEISVSQRASRMFATSLTLADRQTIDVNVRLRPGLAFLGVVGGDQQDARDIEQAFKTVLGGRGAAGTGKWTLIDRAKVGPSVLAEAGATLDALRAYSDNPSAVDWSAVQELVDRQAPGLVYMVAVLRTDLVATEAQVFIWGSAPGPFRPDVLTIPLGNSSALVELRSTFEAGFPIFRSWLGALTIDSQSEPHPRIAYLSPRGPAEKAGLVLGEEIYEVAGTSVSSAAEVETRILAAEIGEPIPFGVIGSNGQRRIVEVVLGRSPRIISTLHTGSLASVDYSELTLMEETSPQEVEWILRLNQSRILMRSGQWEQAVRRLRGITPTESEVGVGKAAIDYWLGLALSKLGDQYADAARSAFERAASQPHARLEHNDGMFVGPRARARLYSLGSR